MKPWSAFVYFIQQGEFGPVKIGVSRNVRKRLKALQTASPFPLKVLGAIEGDSTLEASIQEMFEDLRLSGEWFKPDSDLLEYIAERKQVAV